MQIWIKKWRGGILNLEDMERSDSIGKLKTVIYDKEGVPPEFQRLIFAGEELANDVTFLTLNIGKNTIPVFHLELVKNPTHESRMSDTVSLQTRRECSRCRYTLDETEKELQVQIKRASPSSLKDIIEQGLHARDLLEWKLNLATFFQCNKSAAVVTVTDVQDQPRSFTANMEMPWSYYY